MIFYGTLKPFFCLLSKGQTPVSQPKKDASFLFSGKNFRLVCKWYFMIICLLILNIDIRISLYILILIDLLAVVF